MRSAASLHLTEARGDLGAVDVIKTNFSSAHHDLGAWSWSQRIFRVTHTILSRVPEVAIVGNLEPSALVVSFFSECRRDARVQ
jgi:hypothetical protein